MPDETTLQRLARRPLAAAISVGIAAVLLQPVFLIVVGANEVFPAWGYLFWVPWFLVMGPGITLMKLVRPSAVSQPAVTLFSLVFGTLLWSCLTYRFLVWYSRRHNDGE